MEHNRPSKPLLVVLAGSLLLAGVVYGRPLFSGSEDSEEEIVEPTDLGYLEEDGDSEELVEADSWVVPESPRNPFLEVEIGTPPPDTDEADVADVADLEDTEDFQLDLDDLDGG
jgi:hypothetical protein